MNWIRSWLHKKCIEENRLLRFEGMQAVKAHAYCGQASSELIRLARENNALRKELDKKIDNNEGKPEEEKQ